MLAQLLCGAMSIEQMLDPCNEVVIFIGKMRIVADDKRVHDFSGDTLPDATLVPGAVMTAVMDNGVQLSWTAVMDNGVAEMLLPREVGPPRLRSTSESGLRVAREWDQSSATSFAPL